MIAAPKHPSPHALAVQLGRQAARAGKSAQSNPYKASGRAYASAWLAGYHSEKRAIREEVAHGVA